MEAKRSAPGPERFVLAVALLVPLAVTSVALAQIPGVDLRMPASLVYADQQPISFAPKRPGPSNQAPPPTLAAPTATPKPTPTAVPTPTPVPPSPTPVKGRTYTVQKGDELKNIAAQYNVSIWKIIDTNDIPDPDSLRVGQVLKIPDE